MTRFFTILLLALGFCTSAQIIKIDTLKLPPSQRFNDLQTDKMNYPIIKTGNQKTDSLINYDLKNAFTNNEYPTNTIDSTLIKWADDGIIFLDFTVTYCQNNIISLNINAEGCGAYCSSWTDYFNYSTLTGKALNLNDIVDTVGDFRKLVYQQANTQYDKNIANLKAMMMDKTSDIDTATYNWALEFCTNCQKSMHLRQFALYPTYLEVIEICALPHMIQNLTPSIDLKY